MKPLLDRDLAPFLSRFEYFIDAELRFIEVLSSGSVKITLAAQDSARGFDWIAIELEFNGISDAGVPDNSKLSHIDMSDGITLTYADSSFAFAIGKYETLSGIKNSLCFILSSSLKYREASF